MLSSEAIRQNTKLTLCILGNLALEDGLGNHIKISNRKACGLLAYLAINGTSCETRERLAGLLWSDRGEEQARASLRQCLKQLRKIFDDIGFTGFETDRQYVSLARGQIDVDIQAIAEAVEGGTVPGRLLSKGCEPHNILYGFESLDQSFAAWLHVVRQNWHDRLVDHLQRVLRGRGGISAQHAAEALVRIDPTHEEAHRHLIRHHADNGNTAAALNQYKLLWDLLGEEYDTEPSEETQALIAQVKLSEHTTPHVSELLNRLAAEPAPRALPPVPSRDHALAFTTLPVIGIGQFSQGGSWSREQYMIAGFRRELVAALVRFREWIVVECDDTSSLYGNGHSRAVNYRLEGTYFEENGSIVVVITLLDLTSAQYIWSEKVQLSLEAWQDARKRIIQRTAVALNVYISTQRLSQMTERPAISTALYDRWLRAQELSLRWRRDAHVDAIEILYGIICEAPNFAPAYCSLVDIENTRPLVFPGVFRSRDRDEKSLEVAKTAVQLDPIDTKTQLCLAWSQSVVGQFDQATLSFSLAYELNENDPWTLASSALGLAYCGEPEKACQLADHAVNLGFTLSANHWGYQAGIRFLAGDYDGCVEAAEKSDDTLFYLPAWKAAALSLSGRVEDARSEGRKFIDLTCRNWHGSSEPEPHTISSWLLDVIPIKEGVAGERLRTGLSKAGIPIAEPSTA